MQAHMDNIEYKLFKNNIIILKSLFQLKFIFYKCIQNSDEQ